MRTIYKPTGRAEQYSLLALNLYNGCSHGCTYCYAPKMMRTSPEQFHAVVTPRRGIIEALRKDAPKYAGTDERVLLCFSCDPYSPRASASGVTRQALEILREHDIPFQVLTKGGGYAVPDFDVYGRHDAFAATMTFMEQSLSELYEPGAALPWTRARTIMEAHRRGIETWVSLEPVISPSDSLAVIEQTHEFVDLYKIGKLNHDPAREAGIDWGRFALEAMNLCNKYDVPFIFKNDLLAYCDFEIVGAAKSDPRKIDRD